MTSKTVELAIFWLPLIAAVLLGGIAGSAWYGGDKIPAIWIAFFGAVCFLLTATLQFQQYAYANLLQPEIEMVAPSQRSIVTWNPPESFFFNSRAEDQPAPRQDRASSPVIVFENKSNIIGQDASISWEIPRFDVQSLVDNSQRLKAYEVKVDGDTVILGARPPITQPVGLSMRYQSAFKQNVPPIAFLGKRIESWIPIELWNEAILYFIATLPDTIGDRSPPLIFNVNVKWNIPESSSKGAAFKVTAVATNANTPNVQTPYLTAYVSLVAEKVSD
jgi:hypothetical protein